MTTQTCTTSPGDPSPWARPDDPTPSAPGAPVPPPVPPPGPPQDPAAPPHEPPPAPPEEPAGGSPPPEPRDRSRAGAVWVTGTGAFLLVAAAAVFVAVQWDHLSNEVKLGILATVTGAFLLAGRRLRTSLPATSGVLYHLGAFLIPANAAAVGMHLQLEWPPFLLLEGATATLAWTALGRAERSPVLRWATGGAVIVTAAGVGAVTHSPTALLLALCAAGAEAARRHPEATGWALVAGLAPAISLSTAALPDGVALGVETLGLTGRTSQLTAVATGAITALVLGRNAQRRKDLVLVACAGAALALGVAAAWVAAQPPPDAMLIGVAGLFVGLEVIVHLVDADRFWGPPARLVGIAMEVVVATLTPLALGAGAWALVDGEPLHIAGARDASATAPALLLAGALTVFGWFVADLRRRERGGLGTGLALLVGGGFAPTTVFGPLALLAGLACATASVPAVTVTAVALAALVIVSGRPLGHATAACLVITAVSMQGADALWGSSSSLSTLLLAGLAFAGAAQLAWIAVIRAGMGGDEHVALATAAACAAVGVLEIAWLGMPSTVDAFVVLLGLAGAAWVIGLLLDRAPGTGLVGQLGWVGRGAALLTLAQGMWLPNRQLAVLASAVVVFALAEAIVRRVPAVLYALAVGVPVAVAAGAAAAPLGAGGVGVALCVAAAVAAGIQLLLPERWSAPPLSIVVSCAAFGLAASTSSLSTASTALLVLGGIGMAYSVVGRSVPGVIASAAGATLGLWGHLSAASVTALDAYLAPVAVGLLVAGWQARAQRAATDRDARAATGEPRLRPARTAPIGSWVAYAPAIIMLGGSALLERVQGGAGIHALVAGAVGLLAVLAGGARRLIAPLLLGTALLLGLTANESLSVTRAVPTWGWLALGGAVLVAAGIAMERAETGPVESGRRLVDVVSERFS